MITELSYEKAKELLERAVEEKGADYVYPKSEREGGTTEGDCQYFVNGKPSCIAGHVLHYMSYETPPTEGQSISSALDEMGIGVDDKTGLLLSHAQSRQDEGGTWGDSLSHAVAMVSLV